MDRAAEIALEEEAAMTSQASRMHLKKDLRKIRCGVFLCLLSVLVLTLPTAYLLAGNLRAPSTCSNQVRDCRFLAHAYVQPALSPWPEPTNRSPLLLSAVKKQDFTNTVGNQLPILQWEDKRGLAFTKNNLSYFSNTLVIPVSGDYYVYAQVTFRGPIESSSKTNSVTEIITKVTDSYPEPTQLLTGTKTLTEKGNSWFQPIYLGAVVSLEAGDKLMVNVSDIKLVDYTKEHKTFFGAFLL
ncbi:TNF15 factor, partial [Casuarius casuarius]|nr:TNF15 factor [Casuarius casuarius]